MSALVALKMEGRFAGAILTVLSLADVTTGERCQGSGVQGVGYIFSGPARSCRRELCDFGTQNQFCGEPRQGCAVRRPDSHRGAIDTRPARCQVVGIRRMWKFNRPFADRKPTPAEGYALILNGISGSLFQILGRGLRRESCEPRDEARSAGTTTPDPADSSRCLPGYPPRRGCEASRVSLFPRGSISLGGQLH